jgi:hypothetical protein
MHNVFKNTMTPRADRVLRRKRDPWGNLFQLLLPKALKIPTGRFSDLIHFVTFPSLTDSGLKKQSLERILQQRALFRICTGFPFTPVPKEQASPVGCKVNHLCKMKKKKRFF